MNNRHNNSDTKYNILAQEGSNSRITWSCVLLLLIYFALSALILVTINLDGAFSIFQHPVTKISRIPWNYPSNLIIIGPNELHQEPINNLDHLLSSPKSIAYLLPTKKTTIIIMCYRSHNGIFDLISTYADPKYIDIVEEIVIIWNNPNSIFDYARLYNNNSTHSHSKLAINIYIYQQSQNSLANRWMITNYHSFKTQSAMIIDDDVYATKDRINCLLNVWNDNKHKIVSSGLNGYRSFTETSHELYEFHYKHLEIAGHKQKFNMLLPGWGMTMNIETLHKLSIQLVEYNLFDIIDQQIGHCDDIAMTLTFGSMNQHNTFLYGIDGFKLVTDESLRNQEGIEPIDDHNYKKRRIIRGECLTMLIARFRDYGLTFNPIKNHYIGQDTINCNESCPASACWTKQDSINQKHILKKTWSKNKS